MKPTTPLKEGARVARAALLKRAQWIVDANVYAACGYVPVLPPDMQDFEMVRNMDPDPKASCKGPGLLDPTDHSGRLL